MWTRGPSGASRNGRGERSFIEGSDRWKLWPSFFHRLNLAGRWWTMVSGEYEDDIDTTLTPPGTQYGTGLRKESSLRMRYLEARANLRNT